MGKSLYATHGSGSLIMENNKKVRPYVYTTLKRTAIPNKESVNMFNLVNWRNPTGMYH